MVKGTRVTVWVLKIPSDPRISDLRLCVIVASLGTLQQHPGDPLSKAQTATLIRSLPKRSPINRAPQPAKDLNLAADLILTTRTCRFSTWIGSASPSCLMACGVARVLLDDGMELPDRVVLGTDIQDRTADRK